MPFLDSLDIGNRALQHCGARPIAAIDEDSKNNDEVSNAYDKVRRAELRRNVWRFAIRKAVLRAVDVNTLLLNPPAYDINATYLPGQIVADTNGQLWISQKPDNVGNSPGGNNEYWDSYFGPLTVSLYDATISYFAGEIVYKAGAVAGAYQVYMSLKNGNADAPDVADAWAATTTYFSDQVVSYSGSQWRNLLPFNLNIAPADGPSAWAVGTTYSAAATVTGSDNAIYSSVGNGNVGNDPTTDGGVHWTNTNTFNAWSRTPTITASATSWRPLGNVALRGLSILYPIGSGPSSDTATLNVFRLPSGYLREAPQDPKAGSNSFLGAPSGLFYDDWNFEGDYLVSSSSGAITFRFVADVTIVRKMDDMFCEGLACRIAEAVCEPVTGSIAKLTVIAQEYARFMGEARTVNAMETGPVEPPVDDFLACRL